MSGRRWSKFWWQDWQRDPALRMCSPAARGVWMDLLCIMADADPRGRLLVGGNRPTVKQLAGVCGVSPKEMGALLEELEDASVFSRTDDGTIYSRRMVRDEAQSAEGREHVSKRWGNDGGPNTPPNRVNGDHLEGSERKPTSPPTADPYTLEAEYKKLEAERKKEPPKPPAARGAVCDDPDFEAFWQRYPRRDDKGHARKAWKTALSRASPDQIIAGLERYQFSENPRFRPLPATWLNGERWLSEQQSEDEAILRAAGVPLDDPPIFEGRFRLQ